MPAFDPVRDAVLNSPISRPTPLPTNARLHIDLALPTAVPPNMVPHAAEHTSSPALVSPLTRRATDLSVLLNSDPPPSDTPLFTPTTPRAPATLSHLLLPDSEHDVSDGDQLSNFAPLRRRSSSGMEPPSRRDSGSSSYFPYPSNSSARTHSVSAIPASQSETQYQFHSHLAFPGAASPPASSSRPSTSGSAVGSRPSTAQPPVTLSMPPPQTPHRASAAIATTNVNNAVAAAVPLAMPPPPRAQYMPTRPISPPPKAPPPAPAPASVPGSAPAPMPTPKTQTPRPRTSSGTALPAKPLPMSVSAPSLAPSLPRKPSPVPGPSRATPDAGPSISADASSTVKRSTIPYAPTRRITPATSVLVPLSPAEMERYRNYPGGIGSMMLRRKRKREDELSGKRALDEGEEDEESARKKRKLGDVGIVVEHYNTRPDVGVTQRQDSPIIGLKSFNNWVKSVLITRFAYPALMDSPNGQGRPGTGRGTRGRVLDMGCGKGGDLTKWSKAKVADYVGLDIAAVSIEQAQMRHASARGSRFTATFFALDCYAHVLSDVLPAPLLSTPFDVVSMQFCMHYAFESEKKARTMLQNVAGWLRRGGVFIGTIPDAEQLLDRLDALPKDAKELSFGNSVYKIRFEDRTNRPTFGHKYWFFLQDAVDDVPEYVVQWDNFVKLAAEFDLQPVYKKEFHQVFEEHHEHSEFGPLLERMRVVDANGESQMDEDQWEAANIYIAFAFEKR